ncbi:Uncharacterised protein [Bordetella pertussis]|nr:Uncharacterised protein [Bordetella pertussis]
MLVGVGTKSISGSSPQASANCVKLMRVCRNTACAGSITFSWTCSQLHGYVIQ